MKLLLKLWPWKEIARLEHEVRDLNVKLAFERDKHATTAEDLRTHKARSLQDQQHLRKAMQIIAIKGGIIGLFLFFACSVFGQPIQRQLFTTNPPPLLSSIAGPFVTTNGAGVPVLSYNGGAFTNVSGSGPGGGVAVAQGTNIITTTNGGGTVVTVNATTDTNMINLLSAAITNGAINNLSNYVAALGSAITNGGINNLSNYVNALGAAITNGGITQLSNYVNALGAAITNGGINNLSNYVNALGAAITNGGITQLSNYINTVVSKDATNYGIGQISFTADGGGLAVATNKSFWVRVPWSGTILSATLLTDVSCNIGFDVWKTNYAQYPPLVANTIVASAPPAMAAATKYQDATLTGWQKSFVSNDVFKFIIYSNSAATQITLNLDVIKQ